MCQILIARIFFCFRFVPGPVAARYAARLRRAAERTLRSGRSLPAQGDPGVAHVAAKRAGRGASGEGPRPQDRRVAGRVRAEGAQRRVTHAAPAIPLRQARTHEPAQDADAGPEAAQAEEHGRHSGVPATTHGLRTQHREQREPHQRRLVAVRRHQHVHVHGQQPELRESGRHHRHERNRDVHGRVEERQAMRIRHQRALRRPQVRGRVVQQQEVRLRRHHVQGRRQGGRQVQEQLAHLVGKEVQVVSTAFLQAARACGQRGFRGPARSSDSTAESGHRNFQVSVLRCHCILLSKCI